MSSRERLDFHGLDGLRSHGVWHMFRTHQAAPANFLDAFPVNGSEDEFWRAWGRNNRTRITVYPMPQEHTESAFIEKSCS